MWFGEFSQNIKGSPSPRATDLLLEVLRTQPQVPLLRAQGIKEQHDKLKHSPEQQHAE